MTKSLQEEFGMYNSKVEALIDPRSLQEVIADAKTNISELTVELSAAQKIDEALPTVVGLQLHETEMDDIATKAVQSYQDLMGYGMNSPDSQASKVFETAAAFLKTALEARDAKISQKLKIIELQLKKAKFDQVLDPIADTREHLLDRNNIIKLIREGYLADSNTSDKSANNDK